MDSVSNPVKLPVVVLSLRYGGVALPLLLLMVPVLWASGPSRPGGPWVLGWAILLPGCLVPAGVVELWVGGRGWEERRAVQAGFVAGLLSMAALGLVAVHDTYWVALVREGPGVAVVRSVALLKRMLREMRLVWVWCAVSGALGFVVGMRLRRNWRRPGLVYLVGVTWWAGVLGVNVVWAVVVGGVLLVGLSVYFLVIDLLLLRTV